MTPVKTGQVCAFKQLHKEHFTGLLEGQYCGQLEMKAMVEILGDFPNNSIKGQQRNQQINTPLEMLNLMDGEN